MGNNNSMVSVMFEEIKSLLKSIEKKLDEKAVVKEIPLAMKTITESNPESKPDMIKPGQLIRVIHSHLQGMKQKTGQVSGSVSESEKRVLFQMGELKRAIVNAKKDRLVRHQHVVDLKSSKVVIAIVSLSVLLLASLFGNIRLLDVKSRMLDNDMRYRYIRSTNGISPKNLDNLEDNFNYHRDKIQIREIRVKVEKYERKLEETSRKLEKERSKDTLPKN